MAEFGIVLDINTVLEGPVSKMAALGAQTVQRFARWQSVQGWVIETKKAPAFAEAFLFIWRRDSPPLSVSK
ncbi:hypothetical protein EAO82_12725 [Halopseudomonas pelagia]|uniref:Uncharacterized protein n=1 Tax=Halopseudomonas pelagia TaxID=553151 RepID=A0AA91U0N5_9GAMM|nr:hypothetical protein CO192_16670 [Halopseudomonas pelagia]QFY57152.1 hypothetical protein EAO82_12725 [Halopseudomonas pelagia]